ncbi:MipA/OmpV family protein [Azospirillum sp. YIM B02556]|uniref:MipA/OmpV family protein n=1 Tax=Azospirillum endophyticum TaxID=2800326 RepID=A0ABS1F580_9PROT|nr:MipA/OmpV family protein [Azospirillum endophyticum]MBK1838563.1 MipA/OmpV family protein [Azospirillum endophyticum]
MSTTLAVAASAMSAILCLPVQGNAQDSGKPLFEIGIGGGAGYIPDYPAADQNHVQAAALPYVIYRGDVFRADRNGIQGRLYRSGRVTFEVSLEGALGSSADHNRARQGMPDIDLLGEVGPALKINLLRDVDRRDRVDLTLPVRSVFSIDFSRIKYRGLVFAPDVAYSRAGMISGDDQFRLSLGPIFASSHLMDYFYQVDPQYARPDRPAYDARAGYLGLRLHSSLVMPVTERISAFGAVRGELFSGATNDDSPLYKRTLNLSVGAGFTFSLYRSDSRVSAVSDILD